MHYVNSSRKKNGGELERKLRKGSESTPKGEK